jgi:protein phosphatase 1 regulatory subunit 7
MVSRRINNPDTAALESVEQRLAAGEPLVVQFDHCIYTPALLAIIDSLCARFGAQLHVRFYGHHTSTFDCRTLERLASVANMGLDSLLHADNTDVLGTLACLSELRIGIFELKDKDILRFHNLQSLRSLTLGDTRTKAIDLSFLAAFQDLELLRVSGHTRGLDAIKGLPALETLALNSIGRLTRLDFLSEMPVLQHLTILLGGRTSIAGITAERLRELEVCRVQGLTDVGDLARFPSLASFALEDQIRVTHLTFASPGSRIESLRLGNCKSLSEIVGLERLSRLRHLRIAMTALDPDALLASPLPASLETVAIYTGNERENKRIRAALDARGYAESSARLDSQS